MAGEQVGGPGWLEVGVGLWEGDLEPERTKEART